VSHAIARSLVAYGVDRARVDVVHSAVNPSAHGLVDRRSERDAFLRRFALGRDTVVVGTIGALTPQKGQDVLLDALAEIGNRGSGIGHRMFCYIAGAGESEAVLKARAAGLGLGEDKVVFLGERRDITPLLAATDVFVLASTEEGLGTVLLDAAHAGCALIATNVGGIPEIVLDDESGLLCPPRDAVSLAAQIARCASDELLRERLAAGARDHVERNFTWDSMVKGNLAVYESVIDG
jgi:glycosyltransferase involved in cell wall biosynthesis